jgi:hypothetical protein
MNHAFSDENGEFALQGTAKQFSPIQPAISITHDCDRANYVGSWLNLLRLPTACAFQPCLRRFYFKIPQTAIGMQEIGPKPDFDTGDIELSDRYPGEKLICIP